MNPNPPQQLHDLGQSLWLDNITRTMLKDGTIRRYVDEHAVTGLTSNPSIFEKAMGEGDAYDAQIRELVGRGRRDEDLFFDLAIDDLRQAADLFEPIYRKTGGVDGWVSLEVSPLLADDAEATIAMATSLHARADRENLFIKIPGTKAGTKAIEETIFAGVPVNVTLLFSREQYLAAAEAYLRGIERRVEAGLDPVVESVASLFISRWDVAVQDKGPPALKNTLGLAVAARVYAAYRELLASERWRTLAARGAHPQRLLWASTGMKDTSARDTLYIEKLAAPDTVDTMPDKTLLALADHGEIGAPMATDGSGLRDADATIAAFAKAGVDVDALAAKLQDDAAAAFVKSWKSLLDGLKKKTTA